jgi:hypothetical protein
MKLRSRRARALRKDQDTKPFANPCQALLDDDVRIERSTRACEEASVFEQGTQPATTEGLRLDRGRYALECGDRRGDIAERGVVGHDHGRAGGQAGAQAARIEVQQPDRAQRIVHERERGAHDSLPHECPLLAILGREQVQEHERPVAKGRCDEVRADHAKDECEAYCLTSQLTPPARGRSARGARAKKRSARGARAKNEARGARERKTSARSARNKQSPLGTAPAAGKQPAPQRIPFPPRRTPGGAIHPLEPWQPSTAAWGAKSCRD